MSKEEAISALCRPVVEEMGFEWVGVEYHHHLQHAVLRIYVDRVGGGISMDEVVAITEQLNPLLDVEEPISGHYTLEVSSPGLDRPLFTLAQFEQFIGEQVRFVLKRPIDRRRKFSATLTAVNTQTAEIVVTLPAGQTPAELVIAFDNIDRARLQPSWD